MNIPTPKYNLGINSLSHGAMTGRMIEDIENILIKEKADWLLVYGDTNSTLAGAIAASKINVKIAHVEAGLRSFNMKMPEEVNRILTDRVSNVLFCPTQKAVDNLSNEGYQHFNVDIIQCGDVMYDSALLFKEQAQAVPNVDKNNYALVTLHRAENTDDIERLNEIMGALEALSSQVDIVFPIHPRTLKVLKNINYDFSSSNIQFIDPVGYLQVIYLIDNSKIILTDSGGLQKEAFFYKKPCVTLRDETEWVELVELGVNILTGASKANIINAYNKLLNINFKHQENIYGDGDTSKMIVEYFKTKINA